MMFLPRLLILSDQNKPNSPVITEWRGTALRSGVQVLRWFKSLKSGLVLTTSFQSMESDTL